ncbi:MAG: cytochrome c biogenesis protein CcsA [Planctomycetes bacterium]|nr:cytochrome c biogenesis protein CcsA [Planctomycetota bacterium]
MSELNDSLRVLLPMFYLAAVFAYWLRVEMTDRQPKGMPILVTAAALLTHLLLLIARGVMLGQAPWTTYYDTLSALAFVMTVTYALVELISRSPSTGLDLMPYPFLLVTIACAFGPAQPRPFTMGDHRHFVLHTVPAIGGIAAILVSGLYGMLYIRLEKAMRRKRFGRLFARLPDLGTLARMNYAALIVGLVLVTAAIGWGAAWYGELFRRLRLTEPKILLTLVVWCILLLPIFGKLTRRWTDRATALTSLVSMLLVVVSMLVTFLPFVSFHGHR